MRLHPAKKLIAVRHFALPALVATLMMSCSSYKQDIMFKNADSFHKEIKTAESNYIIQKNDYLQLDVFTNNGERVIDPDSKLTEGNQLTTQRQKFEYLINDAGEGKFPLLGNIKIEGLTIRGAEELLQKEYAKFYTDPFVTLKFMNKRVIILGAPGGQVIPLLNENIRLTEALAMAKGVTNNAKAHNIRILRGEQVFVADLSTIEGYTKSNIVIQPGDIIYIEPIRKSFLEGVREYGPITSLITSVAALVLVITTSTK